MKRHDGREVDELRPISITYGIYEYASGSILFELGKTKILCAITLQPSVPVFLRGRGSGWLTAEYALLPAATVIRTNREISLMRRQGRSIEISRLISRALRTIVDLGVLGERTIMVDCDVLQADGGTRTASITAAYAALLMAEQQWLANGTIVKPFLKDSISAVSVGVLDDHTLVLDPDYKEDSSGVGDINVIMTLDGKLIELQGGAEKEPIDWTLISQTGELARSGIAKIKNLLEKYQPPKIEHLYSKKEGKVSLFSLQNRQQHQSTL